MGRALVATQPPGVQILATDRTTLNIADPAQVAAAVTRFAPDIIINAAAYTAVDAAESNKDMAYAINAVAPRLLALAAKGQTNCRLIHVSTDYVFNGNSTHAYLPTDPVEPLGVYGHSKACGDAAVLAALGPRAVVMRTAWVYAAQGKNFLHTMLRLMKERGKVRVVADQIGAPTAAESLASALWIAAARPQVQGIHHWTDAGVASWYDFAVAIAEEAAALGMLPSGVTVEAITTADFPTTAARPAWSLLNWRATAAALEHSPQHWRVRLRTVLHQLKENSNG